MAPSPNRLGGENTMTAIRRSAALLAATIIIALAALFDAGTASAQCPTITVVNNTNRTIWPCLLEAGGSWRCLSFPAGTTTGVAVANPTSVMTRAGTAFLFVPCTPCISIPGPVPVCATVCYDRVNCILTFNSCSAPCIS